MTIEDVAASFTSLQVGDDAGFEAMRRTVAAYQRRHNAVYGRYCDALGDWELPYLPVEAFKYEPLYCTPPGGVEHVFESSGTGRGVPSRHHVCSLAVYDRSLLAGFRRLVGEERVTLLAHLPHYEAMGGRSSLLYMVARLIDTCGDARSATFLDDDLPLRRVLAERPGPQRLVLFGAAFGLLDLAETRSYHLPDDAVVIETGGMKTYRREVARDDLHVRLADGFGISRDRVWSEYGMCELLSQCYTRGGRVFVPPPWVRFDVVSPEDPRQSVAEGEAGALALFDLANLYSVSAVLTQDRAVRVGEGFELTGRLAGAELRGCNFLIEQLP